MEGGGEITCDARWIVSGSDANGDGTRGGGVLVGSVGGDVGEGFGLSAVVVAVMDVVGLACGLDVEGAVGARDLFEPVSGGVSGVGGIG